MLRPLKRSDLKLIFSWRNDESIRQASFSQHEITWEEHSLWFQTMLADKSKCGYLYFNEDKKPDGVVNFTELDTIQCTAFWGLYANPHAALGTGIRMSLDALDHAFNKLRIQKLNAEILASNQRSLDMHKKVGFIEEGRFRDQYYNGNERIDVIRFGMLASDWLQSSRELKSRIAKLKVLNNKTLKDSLS